MLSGVILEIEDSVRQIYKRVLFLNYKKIIKKTPDLSKPMFIAYFHCF